MFYKLLGMITWNAGKVFLRRKYARSHAQKPLLAGGLLVLALAALLLANSRRGDS